MASEAEPSVTSPCIGICVIAPGTDRCSGCERTLDEIARWSTMSEAERRTVMADLAGRRPG